MKGAGAALILPRLTLALLVLPVAAGLAGTLLPAVSGFQALIGWPGLPRAAALSVISGAASTLIALGLTGLIVAMLHDRPGFALLRRLLSPLLAVPHAAAALGLAFLIAPSGWIVRALSPWATGWQVPPDLLLINDPGGIALTLGLVAKEVPFLLLMALAALPACDAPRRLAVTAALGYGRLAGFALAVWPALYARLRLPVMAVLAYGMTTVEMAAILGPTLPPTLSVQVAEWMMAPTLDRMETGAAGAALQLALVLAVMGLWHLAGRLGAVALRRGAEAGRRVRMADGPARALAALAGYGLPAVLGLALAGLALWSVAGRWDYPAALPEALTLKHWARAAPALGSTLATTLAIAATATATALVLVIGCLEAERRAGLAPGRAAEAALYLPLMVPQIAFLPGLQMAALALGLDGHWPAVAAAHLIFVLPYAFLSLAPAFRGWDARHGLAAATLGAGPARIFWRIRLPMLLAPVATAAALGLAVSVGQYLPTLLIGAGRVGTLTTEAVALASGGNRRLIGAWGLAQLVVPAAGFALALALPRLVFRHRRAMLAGGAA